MIQELREYSQSFLFKLLLGVICVTFVVSFGVGSFGDRKEVIAKVNGREILLRITVRPIKTGCSRCASNLEKTPMPLPNRSISGKGFLSR